MRRGDNTLIKNLDKLYIGDPTMPKVHKVNLSLRPFVAFVGSPTYNLSKFLINVLSPLLKQTYSVKKLRFFEKQLLEVQLQKENVWLHAG